MGRGLGAADPVVPLQPQSALSVQRHLLLVHEPSQHTKRDSSTVCRRGRHPLTPRGWERGPAVVGGRAQQQSPPELLTASTGRLHLWQKGVSLVALHVSCMISTCSFTLKLSWLPARGGCGWPQGLRRTAQPGAQHPRQIWHRLPRLQGNSAFPGV